MNQGYPPSPYGPPDREPPSPFQGPFIPAGMPPGTEYQTDERAPEGVTYFRIYAIISTVLNGLVVLMGFGVMLMPFFVTSSRHGSGPDIGAWIGGLFYVGLGIVFSVPALIALFAGRKPWAHTLGTVVIALGMTNFCCIPILVPVLIQWMKPETKRWYGAT